MTLPPFVIDALVGGIGTWIAAYALFRAVGLTFVFAWLVPAVNLLALAGAAAGMYYHVGQYIPALH